MYAYCGNNPINRFDPYGMCYFDANGNWCHDNWEYIGGYERKTSPIIEKHDTSSGILIIVDGKRMNENNAEFHSNVHSNIVIARDLRKCKDGCGGNCNPNIQLVNSYTITSSVYQSELLEMLYQYDQMNPSTHTWGRTIDSMMLEWDVHNKFHRLWGLKRLAHTDFDKNDEGTTRWQFLQRAIKGMLHI